MLAAGDLVGTSYRIVRLIGQGGMGEVYEALHEPLSRRVAIKTIREEIANDDLVLRFRREAEASAALGHPNIVQVTDFILEPGRPPAMVMELLDGRTLKELVASAQRLEPSRAVFIALQVLSGLAAAHKAGIIHRDVKPPNVFLQSTLAVRDHVKLLDFGVAKLIEDDRAKGAAPMTRRGIVLGTRAYMAPEQAVGGEVDGRADLYAVGATLYYALSGWRPRDTTGDPDVRLPLRRLATDIHPQLAAIVDKALEPEPRARFGTAEEMAQELARFGNAAPGLGSKTGALTMRSALPPSAPTKISEPQAEEAPPTKARAESSTVEAAPHTIRDERVAHELMDSDPRSSTMQVASEELFSEPKAEAAPLTKALPPTDVPFQDITAKMQRATREATVDVLAGAGTPPANVVPSPTMVAPPSPSDRSGSAAYPARSPSPSVPPHSAPPPIRAARPWFLRTDFIVLVFAFVALLVTALVAARFLR